MAAGIWRAPPGEAFFGDGEGGKKARRIPAGYLRGLNHRLNGFFSSRSCPGLEGFDGGGPRIERHHFSNIYMLYRRKVNLKSRGVIRNDVG